MSPDTPISITKTCPHSDGKGLPVCWDCAEEGHIQDHGEAKTGGANPTWQRFKKIRRSLRFRDGPPGKMNNNSIQSIAPEVHPPEEGIEVGTPDIRTSQPGLIVLDGPRIVSPTDKFKKSKPWSFSSEKEAVGPDSSSRVLGLQKRSFQVTVVIAFIVVAAIVIGVAVGITQKGARSTGLSMSGGDQVSSSPPPPIPLMTTATIVSYVTSASSTFMKTSLSTYALPTSSSSSPARSSSEASKTSPATTPAASGVNGHGANKQGGRHGETVATSSATTTSDGTVISTVYIVTGANPVGTDTDTDSIPTQQPTSTSSQGTAAASSAAAPANTSIQGPSSRICIGDDQSTYTDPSSGDKFRLECATAHQGADIENLEAYSMQDCIGLCAKNDQCKGAIWYNVGPQGTDFNYCWLKSSLNDDLTETNDAQSVVRL